MIFDRGLKDKWLIIPIIVLAVSLLIRIYWSFINLQAYPFEHIPDAKNHMSYLFFLAKYGFHQVVTDHWNGFVLFAGYPPGWHFFTLPAYYLTNNIATATFLSLVQSLGVGFLAIFFLGRLIKISAIQRALLFLLFFANPVVQDYIQIGRYPEFLGWVLFIPFFTLILWYRNHKLDTKFLVFVPLYSFILLTHVYTLFIASFLILSLFLVKDFKEKVIISLLTLLSFILTSFWWYDFYNTMVIRMGIKGGEELLHQGSIVSYNTLILLCFLILFYFYYRSCKNKKRELLFYSPLLILSLLMLFRLTPFIPLLNSLWIMPSNMFFLFVTICLFFQIDFSTAPLIKKVLPALLIVLSVSIFVFSFIRVDYSIPKPSDDPQFSETLQILPEVEGRYMFIDQYKVRDYLPNKLSFASARTMIYASVYYNLSTPFGLTHPGGIVPTNMRDTYTKFYGCGGPLGDCLPNIKPLNCDLINEVAEEQNVNSLITYDKYCDLLEQCSYKEKIRKENVCLYIIR